MLCCGEAREGEAFPLSLERTMVRPVPGPVPVPVIVLVPCTFCGIVHASCPLQSSLFLSSVGHSFTRHCSCLLGRIFVRGFVGYISLCYTCVRTLGLGNGMMDDES